MKFMWVCQPLDPVSTDLKELYCEGMSVPPVVSIMLVLSLTVLVRTDFECWMAVS